MKHVAAAERVGVLRGDLEVDAVAVDDVALRPRGLRAEGDEAALHVLVGHAHVDGLAAVVVYDHGAWSGVGY